VIESFFALASVNRTALRLEVPEAAGPRRRKAT